MLGGVLTCVSALQIGPRFHQDEQTTCIGTISLGHERVMCGELITRASFRRYAKEKEDGLAGVGTKLVGRRRVGSLCSRPTSREGGAEESLNQGRQDIPRAHVPCAY
jgi:hypothetical protein